MSGTSSGECRCPSVSGEYRETGLWVLTILLNPIVALCPSPKAVTEVQLVANPIIYIPTSGHGFDSIGFPAIFPIVL